MTQLTEMTSSPTDARDYLDDSFRSWLTPLLEKWHVPGYSVAVISKGEIHAAGYGKTRLPDTPASADTLYLMCSTTKAFTAALVGMCIEEAQQPHTYSENKHKDKDSQDSERHSKPKGLEILREKGWKTPVRDVLPEFVTTDEYVTAHATLEDIASHRSGIMGHDYIWGPFLGTSLTGAVRSFRHLEPVGNAFRAKWMYNNLGYATLGAVAEKVLEKPYEEALREKILEPLGMDETWLDVTRAKLAKGPDSGQGWERRWARGYHFRTFKDEKAASDEPSQPAQEKGYYYPEHYATLTGVEPAGALISSVQDYAKWARGLLDAAKRSNEESSSSVAEKESVNPAAETMSPGVDKATISAKLWREVSTPRITFSAPPSQIFSPPKSPQTKSSGYALGWEIQNCLLPGHTIVMHGGGMPGIATLVATLPDQDFGIVLAGNSDGAAAITEAVAKELLGRRVGLSEEERRKHVDLKKKAEEEGKNGEDGIKALADLEPPQLKAPAATTGPSTSATTHTSTKSTGAQDQPKIKLHGSFHHPAYGTFTFSPAPSAGLDATDPSVDGVQIIRDEQPESKSKAASTTKQQHSNGSPSTSTPPILMTALGHRSLRYRMLLHAASTQPHSDKVLYGLETLSSHGDLSECAFPELPDGWGEPDDKVYPSPPTKKERTGFWGSHMPIAPAGAVAEVLLGGEEGGVRGVWVRLGRGGDTVDQAEREGEAEGGLKPGWQDERIWFTPVLEQ